MKLTFLQHLTIAWKLGIRSNAMRALFAFGAGLLAVAFLAGSFSPRQPLVVTLDMGISGIRLLTALLVLFWMQEAFVKDIERRTLTLAFSLPVDRAAYVLGRFAGVMLLISSAVLLWGGALALLDSFSSWGYVASSRPHLGLDYLFLLFGIVIDAWVIGSFVLLLCSLAETPMLPFLVGAGFAIAARSIGTVLEYMLFSASVDPNLEQMVGIIKTLRWLLPDLSQLDWRVAILYTQPFPWVKAQASMLAMSGYLILFLTIAVIAYRKRELT